MLRVVLTPAEAARALAISAPVTPAFLFAIVAFVLHAASVTSLLLLVAWRHALETASRFGPDNPVGSPIPRLVANTILTTWLAAPCAVAVSLVVFWAACRLHRTDASIADAARAHLYACAVFAPATLPLVGAFALLAFPRFLQHWLAVRAVSPVQSVLVALLPFITALAVATLFLVGALRALGSAPEEALTELLTRWTMN
jgi:hypothetical protein